MHNWGPISLRNSGTQWENLLQSESNRRQGSCELLYPENEKERHRVRNGEKDAERNKRGKKGKNEKSLRRWYSFRERELLK